MLILATIYLGILSPQEEQISILPCITELSGASMFILYPIGHNHVEIKSCGRGYRVEREEHIMYSS